MRELSEMPHACLVTLAKAHNPHASLLHTREELLESIEKGSPLPETLEKYLRLEIRKKMRDDIVKRFRMPDECQRCYREFQQKCESFRALFHWLIAMDKVRAFK